MSDNYENSFYKSDYENAKEAFSKWQSKQHESIDDYLMRKRKVELLSLVREVIENELEETDKDIVRFHWYLGKSITETAELIGSSRSSVSRRLDKINDIIYEKLKYALHYRYGKDFSASARLIIKNKDALCILHRDHIQRGAFRTMTGILAEGVIFAQVDIPRTAHFFPVCQHLFHQSIAADAHGDRSILRTVVLRSIVCIDFCADWRPHSVRTHRKIFRMRFAEPFPVLRE